MLEKPEVVFLKNMGDKVQKGETLLILQENGHQLTVKSPIVGEILIANDNLKQNPELLKTYLFGDGWAYCIKPDHLADIKSFLLGPDTKNWMRQELSRLRDFLAGSRLDAGFATAYLHDGGMPVQGLLKNLSSEALHSFEKEFLHVVDKGKEYE